MRTPEHRAQPRAGKKFEAELDMHYLAPGAFTVLPIDADRLPDPPSAPPPYRLPTTTRSHRHQSFAIIGERTSSNPNSRSSSPSGRVSPFKGHGFNPAGSRHASPSASPLPPEDPRVLSPTPLRNGPSKIPRAAAAGARKLSTGAVFGERVSHVSFPEQLNRQASQSLTSLEEAREKRVRRKPPPSPRKKLKGPPAFKELSPIQGSSPEPSQSLSSPSRIPTKSKSTPPSRFTSPTRERSKAPSKSQSKPNVAKSRDPSPSSSPKKIPLKKYQHVQSKINTFNKPKVPPKPPLSSDLSEDSESPKKKVLSRKNSFNRTASRPNLLPKTFMSAKQPNYTSDSSISTDAVDSSKSKTVTAKTFGAKVTSNNDKTPPAKATPAKGNASSSSSNNNNNNNQALKSNEPTQPKKDNNVKKPEVATAAKRTPSKENVSTTDASNTEDSDERKSSIKGSKIDLKSDDGIPSTMDVVSSTTNTVTKPLKIETPKLGRTKPATPLIDGRVLSATTVSQAINKMNDTVLNTQTLIKDSGLTNRLTSAGSTMTAIKSGSNDDIAKKVIKEDVGKLDVKQEESKKVDDKPSLVIKPSTETMQASERTEPEDKTANTNVNHPAHSTHPPLFTHSQSTEPPPNNHVKILPAVPTTINNHATNNHANNHVSIVGLGNARAIEREVQNNMNKLLGSMDSSLGGTPVSKMSANDRIREARTVIAADIKPIRITVREKPSEVEVQSGNVGPHFGVANGIGERPSLPPPQQQSPPEEPVKEEPPPNRCKRFLGSCTKALTCNRCQRCKRTPKIPETKEEEEEVQKSGCFKCLSKKDKSDNRGPVRINIEDENGQETKKTMFQKLNCCKKNKIGDTQSCFPIGKRKQSWMERKAGSVLETEALQKTKCCSKDGCKQFFRKIFCCCCKKKEPEPPPVPITARKESMVSSKKKSLTPTSIPPPEDTKPKIDASLVEHTSHMKGAIPVLPVWLAWFCCVMNCIGPGTGTILSGLFCLCIGKPRFSQKDGPKPRIGAFIIDLIIGFSQFFTVLFCLVGWGWSIWWGVIMVKIAKKHKKLKHFEKLEEVAGKPQPLAGHQKRDLERGRM